MVPRAAHDSGTMRSRFAITPFDRPRHLLIRAINFRIEGASALPGRIRALTDKILEQTANHLAEESAHERLFPDRGIGTPAERIDDVPSSVDLNGANGTDPGESAGSDSTPGSRAESRRVRRAARVEARKHPRLARAEPASEPSDADPLALDSDDGAEASIDAQAEPPTAASEPVIAFAGSGKRGARTVRRASKKQRAAADAVKAADDNPALGALNRHLNTMTQQLTTAHRVIGRVAAERDALRQQLADLQGIPVEEIVVSTIGASTDASAQPAKASQPAAPSEPTRLAKLNYFGGDDYALMKKRRQMFALTLLVVLIVIWLAARMGRIDFPDNVSRDSLGQIPYIGDLVTIFLAGWIFFRIIKVSSKGVRWVFPSEDQRRRRR